MSDFRLRALAFGPVTTAALASLVFLVSCGGPQPQQQAEQPPAAEAPKPAPQPAPY